MAISGFKNIHFSCLKANLRREKFRLIPHICTMRPTNENSLGDVIKEMLKKYQLEDGLWSAKIIEAWATCMPAPVIQRTQSLSFKSGQLTVHLNSAVVKQELTYIKQDILRQLNDELGEEVILEIVIY